MSQDYLHLVNEIIRGTSIRLDNSSNDIHDITKQIFDKIKACNPPGLKVVTFAILKLRDIADQGSWARHLFPDAPAYYFDETSDKDHYNVHIQKLKTEFPATKIECKSSTVVGSLCEGNVGIDILEVIISNETKINTIAEKHKRVFVKNDLVHLSYMKLYDTLQRTFSDDLDVASFVTMLSVLLQKWNVTVVTANNIIREKELKSGLCGVVLCFERSDNSPVNPFVQNLPAIFAPILQLVTTASLLESAYHYHNRSVKLASILANKVRPAMEMLENIKWEILEAIGGCFGEDLARLESDLTFKRKDTGSLYTLFGVKSMTSVEKSRLGESGIWHLQYSDERLMDLKRWLENDFPRHYVYLSSDPSFGYHFVDQIFKEDGQKGWNQLFSSGTTENPNQLRNLLQVSSGKYFFKPHGTAIKDAFSRNFPVCKQELVDGVLKLELEVGNGYQITRDIALMYLKKTQTIDLSAQFARIRHHPQTWFRLYKGKVSIDWVDATGKRLASVFFGNLNEIPETLAGWVEGHATKILVTYSL